MPNAVISDASCLIVLSKIDAVSLIQLLFGRVLTTPEIAAEVRLKLPEWIEIVSPVDHEALRVMPSSIDRGEATAIALALETPDSALILDDLTARNYAARLGITVTGTLGILINAKLDGHIPSIRPFVEKIRETNFRIGLGVIRDAYLLAGEVES